MKTAILLFVLFIGISSTVNAQTSSKKMKGEKPKMDMKMEMKMKDGVMMADNKMMMCKDNKCTPMTETYPCTDGSKVSTDGTITKSDGKTMKLTNGNEIDKDGKMSMIPHGQMGHVCGPECPMYKKM